MKLARSGVWSHLRLEVFPLFTTMENHAWFHENFASRNTKKTLEPLSCSLKFHLEERHRERRGETEWVWDETSEWNPN